MNKFYRFALALLVTLATTGAINTEAAEYLYNFNTDGNLQEASSLLTSSSKYWWVNSGGYMKIENGKGSTIKDSLKSIDPWRVVYSLSNPKDTDSGYHPQNIFRLISEKKWLNARHEVYFVARKDNLSTSSNRNQSNGLLLFNRYKDSDNLYYTGVRVDGSAIIKKKKNGIYYTLAEIQGIYPGNYDKNSSPNLIPKNKWVGLRSETMNIAGGAVEIRLYVDKEWKGEWELVAKTIDDGKKYGGSAFTSEGYTGIRTDFMDVEFENFRSKDIDSFTF